MATFFDKLIQEIGSRYCIGPKRPNLYAAMFDDMSLQIA
jgi:hypothetical protein